MSIATPEPSNADTPPSERKGSQGTAPGTHVATPGTSKAETLPSKRKDLREAAPRLPVHSLGPCGRWVLVLVLEGKTNTEIDAALRHDALPCPSFDDLDAARAEHMPKGFRPKSRKAMRHYKHLGISAFFPKSAEAEQALVILKQPRLREITEAAIIVNAPIHPIRLTLARLLRAVVSVGAIECFSSTFFDLTTLTRAEVRLETETRVRLSVMRRVSDPKDVAAARRSMRDDPRIVAASLPTTSLAWSAVLMKAGHAPIRRELGPLVGELEMLAVVRTAEALGRGAEGDDRRGESYVRILEGLQRLRERVVDPQADVAQGLAKLLRIQHSTTPIPFIGDLMKKGEQHTVDLGPPALAYEGGGDRPAEHDDAPGELDGDDGEA